MRSRFGRFIWPLFLFATLLPALAPARASAQAWLADRQRAQGRGIRTGDFEIHPGIGAEVGYDSNVFNSSGSTTVGGVTVPNAITSAALIRITPHVYLSTISGQRMAEGGGGLPSVIFSAGLSASYYHWFLDHPTTGTVDNVEGDLTAHLELNPGRPFALHLDERFSRTVRPYADNFGATAPNYGRNTNAAGATGVFSTAGGVLSGRIGYTFVYDFFDDTRFQYGNNIDHQFLVMGSFRFLPRTAIVYDLNMGYLSLQAPATVPVSAALSNGFRVATRIGLNGAFTSRLSASAMVGYGGGFYQDPRLSDYESLIAQLEVRWQISTAARLALGYDRNFYNAFIGNFLRRDRGYANFQLFLSGQFLLGAEVAVGLFDFGTPLAADHVTPLGCTGAVCVASGPGANAARNDVMLIGSLFAEYRFTDWLGLNATLRYTGDFTDWHYETGAGTPAATIAPAKYNKFEAFLGVRVFL